jgi:hypothetical protein
MRMKNSEHRACSPDVEEQGIAFELGRAEKSILRQS